MKLKFVVPGLVVILEALVIFGFALSISKGDTKHLAVVIEVPENMVLTTSNDICYSVDRDKEITVPEGTKITPDYIFPNRVSFSYDGYIHVSGDYKDFVEQAELEELENKALQERANRQKELEIRGTVIAVCIGVCWLILVMAITCLLIKKDAIGILIAVHSIIIILLIVYWLFFGPQYLCK